MNFVRNAALYGGIFLITIAALMPLLLPRQAAAGQMSSRSVSINSGVPSKTNVSYAFTFTITSTTAIKGLKFIACDTAVGTYGGTSTCASGSAPTGLSFSSGPAAFVSQSGFADNANAFARDGTGGTYCTVAANVLCASRATAPTAETAVTRTITFNGIVNPSTANSTFYIGIYTYALTSSASALDSGTVASAVVQTLTVNAAVAEILQFCAGSTTVNDATTSIATDCTAVSGTSLNIGTLDPSAINTSPVATNGGDNKNGVVMLRTNSQNGATVSYDAILQTGTNHTGTLRINGATCSASSVSTDGCIDAAGSQTTFSAGTEKFGMTIGGTNCGSVSGSSYSCAYGSATNHLTPSSGYIGAAANAYGVTNGFAWVENGTVTQIASVAAANAVDDEALVLRFAATPAITTPFGAYVAQADFIAVPSY